MHRCPRCGSACDCDMEDMWFDIYPEGCDHDCGYDDDGEYDDDDVEYIIDGQYLICNRYKLEKVLTIARIGI